MQPQKSNGILVSHLRPGNWVLWQDVWYRVVVTQHDAESSKFSCTLGDAKQPLFRVGPIADHIRVTWRRKLPPPGAPVGSRPIELQHVG